MRLPTRAIPVIGPFVLISCLIALPVRALNPAHLWSHTAGNTAQDLGMSVAVDAFGNVFATGQFTGTINLGGGDLVSAGSSDIYLVKFSSVGAHLWSKRFGEVSGDVGRSLAVDASGNVAVTGSFTGTVNFGGANLISAGNTDIFVAKFGPTGAHLWSHRYGSTSADEGKSVATDLFSDVYVTGSFQGTVNFGGGNLVSAGVQDIFLAKYATASGNYEWSQRFGSTGVDVGQAVTVDSPSGSVFATGYFNGTVGFGGANLVSAGSTDIFLASYVVSTGLYQWSQRFGSTSQDEGNSLAVDPSGNVLLTGYFIGTVNFGGDNLVGAGSTEIFVARYSSGGTHQLSKRMGSSGLDEGNSVVADQSGNILITGDFAGTVNFGGVGLVSAGSTDMFLAKYDPAGLHQWSYRFGSVGTDASASLARDPFGNVVLTGYFDFTVDFGGGLTPTAGGWDIVVAKYDAEQPEEPVITSIDDIGNDQGRKVRINFVRSGNDDAHAARPVVRYDAFRRNDLAPAMTVTAGDLSPQALLEQGWTEVASVHAYNDSHYSIDAPTIGDSTIALGQFHSVFYLRAATDVPALSFDSPIDSGYSLDNLAPGVPMNIVFSSGDLYWSGASDVDFDYFTVYGADINSFAAAIVIDYTVAPTLDVAASPYQFYFVTATDFSGNESAPAFTGTATGVGGSPMRYVLSISNFPNPFNPRTRVNYAVPSRGRVTVMVYDARGARVAALVNNEERDVGAHHVDWDGRDDRGGMVSSGVYFARIEHASGTRSKKMMLLK